jgi:hypothetical protein
MEVATKEESNPIAQDIKKGKLRDYHGPIFWNYGTYCNCFFGRFGFCSVLGGAFFHKRLKGRRTRQVVPPVVFSLFFLAL